MRSRTACMLVLLSVVLFCVPAMGGERTVTDLVGRTVTVPEKPERIICIGPGALRLIVYLQAQDVVVGVESMELREPDGRPYWLAQPQLKTLPVIGPGGPGAINKKPDMEAVLRVAPDLIFVTYMNRSLADEVAATLNIPVAVLSYGELAVFDTAVYTSLHLVGTLLGREERAEAIVTYLEGLRQDLDRRTGTICEDAKPRAYVGGIGYRGSHGIESTQRQYIPLDWNHAVNLARNVGSTAGGSHVVVDKEALLGLNPDVIFIDGGGLALVAEDYRKKPDFYQVLKAFREKRVFTLLPFNFYTTNIGTAMADAYAIGKTIYPQHFSDVDLFAKADAIYTFLVGKPVYAQMAAVYGPIGQAAAFSR
ncbi:iron ABC transporter substrate-binding protein [Desulfosarcina ovata]|nr:iron ABC transporter substrate-binding protein [Desulfosarcina ovata]